MNTETQQFTWSILLAGTDHDDYIDKGEATYEDFMREFDSFPWTSQLKKANKNPKMVSPTLSVKDLKNGTTLWVSMAGERQKKGYVIGYISPKDKQILFGLVKPKVERWLEMYLTEEITVVKDLIRLFFEQRKIEFVSKITALTQYKKMKLIDVKKDKTN